MKITSVSLFFFGVIILCLDIAIAGATPQTPKSSDWEKVSTEARGQTVDWYMWGGSPAVNSFVNGYLAQEIEKRYDITLRQVPVKDIGEIVSKLLVEKEAGKDENGSVDLIWINGENFRACKQQNLLYGPFAQRLPNQSFVDLDKTSIRNDFGTPVEDMESPWGSAQMVMIYDTARMAAPPVSMGELLSWIMENPGRFTYSAPPDFTGSAFLRHLFYHVSGDVLKWQKEYSEEEFQQASGALYQTLRDLKPYLWRNGSTYPESTVRLNSLFVDGEIDFSFSYNPGEASQKIEKGLFPKTARTFIFNEGTISNTHFVAIPFNAGDKAGAMVVADFLLSPEAQFKKADVHIWGDFPAVAPSRLPTTPIDWQQKFLNQQRGAATLSDAHLQSHQLPELPSKILVTLEKGWQKYVLKEQ